MNTFIKGTLTLLIIGFGFYSCQNNIDEDIQEVPREVIEQLSEMGFNPEGIEIVPEGYRIERDIIIRPEDLTSAKTGKGHDHKQYSTNNLVSTGGGRTITVYIPESTGSGRNKKNGFNTTYVAALDIAISRFNAQNLQLDFQRVTNSSGVDITFTKLSKRDERQGYLGSAGFPTNSGDPYGEIKMSSIIDSQYGWDVYGIATVMAHEMGHCIGFRHTDFFDRSLSCGGAPSNEGPAEPIGANHIPGTPMLELSPESWMLSCTGGGDRPFTNDDQTALDYLY